MNLLNRRAAPILAAIAIAAAGGCNHVAYVHDAVLGIDLTAGTEGTSKLVFGYDSETFALVPRTTHGGNFQTAEAMSLVSVSNVDAQGLDDITFNHFVATGAAAIGAAKDPDGLREMRKAVFGQQTPKGE